VPTSCRVLLAVGIGVLAVVAVALIVMLVREPARGASKVPSAQAEAREVARLQAEAIGAAENFFRRVDRFAAQVRLDYALAETAIRAATTGKRKDRGAGSSSAFTVTLKRYDGRWLVAGLVDEGS
jgi:hypothetical protein